MQQPLRPSVPKDLFRSERLVYRAWDAATDIDAVYEWLQDGETVTSMSPRMITLQSKQDVQEYWTKRSKTALFFAVICLPSASNPPSSPQPIGLIDLWPIDPTLAHSRTTTLSIILAPAFQSRGFGTESVRWILGWAFRRLGVHRVGLIAGGWNARARGAYEKAGFTYEGTTRKVLFREGKFWDVINMGILEEEWFAAQEKAEAERRIEAAEGSS
ncbi:hypothetical protein PLICRDRAFT_42462 [Plicaturopsis crispa FD-325 SS-3]|nr:hypothetical protein PLICRDRAFT_42462 [Plicaturopsis crispa FD-325 SS-3]